MYKEIDPRVIKNYLIENGQLEYAEHFSNLVDNLYELDKKVQAVKSESPAPDGWVSVESDLPEKGKPVLLNTEHWIGVGYYRFNHELDIPGEPEWSEENGEYIGAKVTHWQPLPQPPKQ